MARTLQLLLRFVVVTAFGVVLVALIAGQMIPEIAKVPEAVSVTPRSNFVLPTLPEGSTIVDGSG